MLKTDKITRILSLYNRLELGEEINKTAFSLEHNINERSVDRDIEDIRLFLSEIYSHKELNYDKARKVYYLTNNSKSLISSLEIITILKILINSRALRNDEMVGLINTIISLVDFDDKKAIKSLIDNELQNYIPPTHNKAILKMHWDLNQAISKKRKIRINYIRTDNKIVERRISPLAVIFSDYYFYLIAYIDGKDYHYPAFFRLDRINSFKIEDEIYSSELVFKYSVGEMKNNIKFMLGGELINIELKVNKEIVNTIIDQFPNANVIREDDKFYYLRIKVFEEGFVKWVLSNSNNVEVIKPLELRQRIKGEVTKILNMYLERKDEEVG